MIKIARLPDSSADELANSIRNAPPMARLKEMVKYVAERIHSISAEDVGEIIGSLYALYRVRMAAATVSGERFLKDLMEDISTRPDPPLSPEVISTARRRFEILLNIETLAAISKAMRVQREGERLFCDSTILSDMRPVFTDDPAVRPSGFVVNHVLEIEYHENGEHRAFFVVLDAMDLATLKKTVDRASAKDHTLSALLEEAKFPRLGT
jgi:hypothetical protein